MNLATARNILLCLRWGIGDLIMQLPALDALREACPGARIVGVGAEPALQLLADDPRLDETLAVQAFGLTHWGDMGNAVVRGRFGAWLAAERFDLALDPSHAAFGLGHALWWDSGLPLYDSGGPIEAQLLRECGDGLTTVRLAAARGWGIEVPVARPRLRLRPWEHARAEAWLAQRGLAGAEYVALCPVASSPLKCWPLERFAALARDIASRGLRPLLLCGPQMHTAAALEAAGAPGTVVGALHLRQLAALLARCRLAVSNDTGVMHLAAAVGTPVAGLFAPTSPRIYLPPDGWALAPATPCDYRPHDRFGPPACVSAGQCLRDGAGCIQEIEEPEALRRIGEWLETAPRAGSPDEAKDTEVRHELGRVQGTQPGARPDGTG